MTRPLPRWYRRRCDHDRVEIRNGLGPAHPRNHCAKCGATFRVGDDTEETT